MRYLEFTINNFKGIGETSIHLKEEESKIVTLVGLNESGKTTILEAINFLWNDYPDEERHKLIPKNKKYNFNDKVQVIAQIEYSETDKEEITNKLSKKYNFKEIVPLPNRLSVTKYYEYENSEFVKKKTLYSLNLKAKAGRQKNFREYDDESEEWKFLLELVKKQIPKIVYYENFLFNIPHEILIHPYSRLSKTHLPFYQMLQDILDSIDLSLSIEEHIEERIPKTDESSQTALKAVLNKMGGKVTNLVLKPWSEIMKTKEKKIKFYPRIHKNKWQSKNQQNQVINEDAYYLRFDLEDGDETYPISERSLGFRWFFAFLLFTELRKHRWNDPGETLFLLDEPASNLHSTAQQKLLSIYDMLVDGGSKLIYTTHSHHLINPKYLETAYIVKNQAIDYDDEMEYDAAKTDIEATLYKTFVSNHPEQKDYYQPILDVLDYQPGLLEKIPNIVVLEGKHDFYSFHYINEIVLNNKYKIYAYPGFGAGKNDGIIALYLAWSRDLQIFLDSDHRGTKEAERYLKDFGSQLKGKIHTYADVDGSWQNFKIEEVYDQSDRNKIMENIKPNFTTFSKKLFHLEIQNLYGAKKDIGISDKTKENFIKIFEFLNYEKN